MLIAAALAALNVPAPPIAVAQASVRIVQAARVVDGRADRPAQRRLRMIRDEGGLLARIWVVEFE